MGFFLYVKKSNHKHIATSINGWPLFSLITRSPTTIQPTAPHIYSLHSLSFSRILSLPRTLSLDLMAAMQEFPLFLLFLVALGKCFHILICLTSFSLFLSEENQSYSFFVFSWVMFALFVFMFNIWKMSSIHI